MYQMLHQKVGLRERDRAAVLPKAVYDLRCRDLRQLFVKPHFDLASLRFWDFRFIFPWGLRRHDACGDGPQ